MITQLLVGCTVGAAGVALLGLGLDRARLALILWRSAERVRGRVIRHVPMPSDGEGPATEGLEVAFEYGGQTHCHLTSYGSSTPRAVGRPIIVLVPRGRPRLAAVATPGALWLLPALLIWLGIAFLSAGLLLVAVARSGS